MRTVAVGLGCIALAACSSALVVEQSKFAQAQAQKVSCRQETPTGSHLIRRICTTKAEREEQSARAKQELENAMDYQRNRAAMMGGAERTLPTRQ
jgi:hypothetical protein